MTIVQPTTTSPPETAPTEWAPPGWVPPTTPPPWGTQLPPPPGPAPHRKTGRYVVGAVAAVIVVAAIAGSAGQKDTTVTSGGAVTATTGTTASPGAPSAAPAPSSMVMWATLYGSPDSAMLVSDLEAISNDATAYDVAGMASSCRTFQRHLASAEAHLPTPNAALTAELATAYGYFDQAAAACITGATNYDTAALTRTATYIELGGASITRATAILETLT